jgi:hypothetical protein
MGDNFIPESKVEKALDFLRDTAPTAAQARANRIYLDEFRKSLKAQLMQEHSELPLGAQEREAYADERYIQHLAAIREAVFIEEKQRFLRDAAGATIEAWRTASSNYRAMKI